ncbi:MAG: hypothetical protein EBY11_12885 [Proteobacteria bacterium]|nr:hypothetical protein [Pseudomonadota bacterium]
MDNVATGAEWPVIGIVGAGSLGQAYAALLASSGQSVVLLASEASADRLRRAGEVRLIEFRTCEPRAGEVSRFPNRRRQSRPRKVGPRAAASCQTGAA